MRITRTLGLSLLLTLAPVAAARAATIRTTATEVDYVGAAADTIDMRVYRGNSEPELGNASAIYFLPTAQPPLNPGTDDPTNCRAHTSGASFCVDRNLTHITMQGHNDFVLVDLAGDGVRIDAGGGDDTVSAGQTGTKITAYGEAGNDTLSGANSIDILDGGPDDDTLAPRGFGDDVHGGTGFDTVRLPGPSAVATLDETANDGPPGNANENIHSDVEKVVGSDGADDLAGNADANTLDGNGGNDAINGLGGADSLFGGAGDDTITSRDGVADNVVCGPGADRAVVDPLDTVASDCETVEYADGDHDGFDARADCNDANPAIHPGAVDTPGNGVDEDCSGADSPVIGPNPGPGPVDADHDGTSPPVDCNDASAAIHPGATDKPGDGVDQDCSGADAKLAVVGARITDRWTVSNTRARIDRLTIRSIPKGGKVFVDCKGGGCPFKRHSVKVKAGKADAGRLFKGHRLRKGATVQITVTAPNFVGKVLRYTFKGHRKVPAGKQLCLQPGALSASSCG